MKLWAYDDTHNWGTQLAAVASARGHDVRVFEDPRSPDTGFVFLRMFHHPQVRILHKRCMAIMSMNPNLTLVPDYRSSVLYDDKLEQARQLSKWMPRTNVFYTPGSAKRWLERQGMTYPFVSKAAEGVSSNNVRYVQNAEEAALEIRHAFSDIGIKCRYQQTQRGYLLWQKFIEGSDGDVRVLAIGGQRMLLQRSRDKVASAKGTPRPIVSLDAHQRAALAMADTFFKAENMRFGAVDLIRDNDGGWFVVETTVSWNMNGFYESMLFKDGEPTGVLGDKVWEVLCTELENGAFA